MSSRNSRLRVALLAVAVAAAGLALAGPAAAATPQPATTTVSTDGQTSSIPVDFVDLATSPLTADGESHEVTVTYRNDSGADRTVAPQLLVESPDAGPFLDPSDVRVERRTAGGCWKAVDLGSQTGTLFTDLTTARRTLPAGATLTEVYRVTVTDPAAEGTDLGTVHPRVALY
ncbi:signal peptide protein [Streptomyces sp. SP17KL33]|uniref:signal peptide protein n=1 Tax=Streptomyces sp. SP17KL33 TaxID=3002534 RepID=UPI002E7727E5|nr:signal peptide protein [Streptomyces sp. SP17KL33]MEE1832215.1 signal peptide protein [Streptomyces sp. SP17KL33]